MKIGDIVNISFKFYIPIYRQCIARIIDYNSFEKLYLVKTPRGLLKIKKEDMKFKRKGGEQT